jgi:hypothetical protein
VTFFIASGRFRKEPFMPAKNHQDSPSPRPAKAPTPKKPVPLGTDPAFVLQGSGEGVAPVMLTYWDVWYALIAQADFDGSLDRLASHMKTKRDGPIYWDREWLDRSLAHLRDFQKRLSRADVTVANVLSQAGNLAKSESRRARKYILEKPAPEREWSDAMRHLPQVQRRARAMQGRWPRFPVNPKPYAEKMRSRFQSRGFYTEGQSFAVARRLDGFVEHAQKLLTQGQYAQAQAFLRAWITVVVEVIEKADDSYGSIGDSFRDGFRAYLGIDLAATGIKERVFFPDLLEFIVWEDYGLTYENYDGYFRRLTPSQGDLCIEYLSRQADELQAEDLDYQSEGALTLLAQVAAEQDRFERFTDLARRMGSREWRRIVILVDRAVKKRKRALAAEVFEAALAAGPPSDLLTKKYEQLKSGKWDPDPRK